MKVLAIVGSARKVETYSACAKIENALRQLDPTIAWEYLFLAEKHIEQCRGCWLCFEKGEQFCPVSGVVPEILAAIQDADGVLLGSPVYSLHISGLMKTFVDRTSFLFHRPRFFGRSAIVISTTAGNGGKFVLEYLRKVAEAWGMRCIGSVDIRTRERDKNEAYRDKINGQLSSLAAQLLHAMKNNDVTKPTFRELLHFYYMKRVISYIKHDLDFWRENGWLERGWYREVRPNRLKARLADIVVGILFNYV